MARPKTKTHASGYPCPKCRERAGIIDSRPAPGATTRVRRRRACRKCDHRWTTYELDEDELTKLEDAAQRLESIQAALQTSRG